MYFPILVAMQTTGVIDVEVIFDPKSLYLTTELWEMNGLSFWKAFLFETVISTLHE